MAWHIGVPDCASAEEKLFAANRNKIYEAIEYGENYALKMNLRIAFLHCHKKGMAYLAQFKGEWVNSNMWGEMCRMEVYVNIPNNMDQTYLEICDTMRHEIAHALCFIRYGKKKKVGHGHEWIRIAKLLSVNTSRYENEFINSFKH